MRGKRLQTWIDSQYENPRGIVGTYIGEKMVRQHRIEVDWTIEQLDLQPDLRVLDLGCGAGDALAQMLRSFENVHMTGLDRSPTIVRLALRRNRTDVQAGRANVVEGDLGTLRSRTHSSIASSASTPSTFGKTCLRCLPKLIAFSFRAGHSLSRTVMGKLT